MSQKHLSRTLVTSSLAFVLLVCIASCGSGWQATVIAPDGGLYTVDRKVLKELSAFAEEGQDIPLERVLWTAGHPLVERIIVTSPGGEPREFQWAAVADDAWWLDGGQLAVGGETIPVSRVEVEPPASLGRVQADITDLAPTAAAALDLPAPAQNMGEALEAPASSRVVLLFLDGLGHVRYAEALEKGLVPNLAALGEPRAGLTVYPPCTSVASAALLTGAPPEVNAVDQRGIRKTEAETLFDVASAAGLQVVAIEGEALAFNLRNSKMQLSGDRDGNGSTDDNVLVNALAAFENGTPDLFYVHFHGIDDAGHTFGPGAPEEETAIRQVDAAVGQLLEALTPSTLVIIFADHGMHHVEEEGRLGNHGHLIERDMLIPIWVVGK
jgi:hypothetical protein